MSCLQFDGSWGFKLPEVVFDSSYFFKEGIDGVIVGTIEEGWHCRHDGMGIIVGGSLLNTGCKSWHMFGGIASASLCGIGFDMVDLIRHGDVHLRHLVGIGFASFGIGIGRRRL